MKFLTSYKKVRKFEERLEALRAAIREEKKTFRSEFKKIERRILRENSDIHEIAGTRQKNGTLETWHAVIDGHVFEVLRFSGWGEIAGLTYKRPATADDLKKAKTA